MENHDYSDAVIDEIKKIIQLFKERNDSVLRSKHNAHELDDPLNGFSSLHLYPGEYSDKDIVILYKIHRDDHTVLDKIGSHEYVYGKSKRKRKNRNGNFNQNAKDILNGLMLLRNNSQNPF